MSLTSVAYRTLSLNNRPAAVCEVGMTGEPGDEGHEPTGGRGRPGVTLPIPCPGSTPKRMDSGPEKH